MTETTITAFGFCPICRQDGGLISMTWPDGRTQWWHSRPQPDRDTAYCGPFQRPMCRADDRCLERDGHDGPCR